MALVTVIIPTYNNAIYLSDAVESILSQTFSDIEIIVVNDGSTDDTLDILKNYEGKIRLINQENKGVSAARNIGIDLSQSEFIAFLDADDISVNNRIEKQVDYLHKHSDVGFVGSDLFYMDKNKVPITISRMPTTDLSIRWWSLTLIPCYNILIRRSVLDNHNIRFPFGMPYAEDYDFLTNLLKYTYSASIQIPLQGYRLQGKNETISRDSYSKLSYHSLVSQKAIQNELGKFEVPEDTLMQLSSMMIEGVRKYSYSNLDRLQPIHLYLDLWEHFSNKYRYNHEINKLKNDILIRSLILGFFPPIPPRSHKLLFRLLKSNPLVPFQLLLNSFKIIRNFISNKKIEKFNNRMLEN
jgi:glycosyltransferase involved in cell wall biosynthesis